MNRKVILFVEATSGTKVKVGDVVAEGSKLGVASDMSAPVLAPFAGRINSIIFDTEQHLFRLEIVALGP